ncbi:rhodanese-like domain-containing protein [Aerococcaceae bacterium DSM 111022]|nr:rhodanese-like domain-containing protein [Aerococcaceae bacterium DSM 111022]
MKQIHIDELYSLVENKEEVNVLDVRPKEYYDDGHIPGAVHMPMSTLEDNLDKLDKDKTYHVICHDGVFSEKGTKLLDENGFNAINIEQGTPEYPSQLEK